MASVRVTLGGREYVVPLPGRRKGRQMLLEYLDFSKGIIPAAPQERGGSKAVDVSKDLSFLDGEHEALAEEYAQYFTQYTKWTERTTDWIFEYGPPKLLADQGFIEDNATEVEFMQAGADMARKVAARIEKELRQGGHDPKEGSEDAV